MATVRQGVLELAEPNPRRTARVETVRVVPDGSPVKNSGFDVTPARLVTGLITERGVIAADATALAEAFPERSDRKAKA